MRILGICDNRFPPKTRCQHFVFTQQNRIEQFEVASLHRKLIPCICSTIIWIFHISFTSLLGALTKAMFQLSRSSWHFWGMKKFRTVLNYNSRDRQWPNHWALSRDVTLNLIQLPHRKLYRLYMPSSIEIIYSCLFKSVLSWNFCSGMKFLKY